MGAKTLAQDYIFLRVGESTEHPTSKRRTKLNLETYDFVRISLKRTKNACFFDISVVFSLFLLTFCEYLGCLGEIQALKL